MNFLLLGDIENMGADIAGTRLLRSEGGQQIAYLQERESAIWAIPIEYLVQPEEKVVIWESGFACVFYKFRDRLPQKSPVRLWFDLGQQVFKLKFLSPRNGYCFVYLDPERKFGAPINNTIQWSMLRLHGDGILLNMNR